MEYNEICGKRQLEFIKQFDYIREAGTDGEEKAALEIQRELKSFGVDSRLEEFEIDTWRILKAEFTVTEPFEKTYTVAGYGRCGSTPADGIEAPFLYAENGDDIKTVQTNLGHSTASFTLKTYAHVSDQMQRSSAARMEELISSLGAVN